jgi:P pilus assembly chaperone PapD
MFLLKVIHNPLFYIGLVGIVVANAALAAQSRKSSFSISPMVNILALRNGQAKGVINVTNQGQDPLRVRVYSENFTYDRSQGYTTTDNHPQSAVNYLQFSPRELVVPPGITRNVRVGTSLPGNLPDGEYRAAIFIEDLKEREISSDSGGQRIAVQTRVASVFYFNKGQTTSELSIASATWRSPNRELLLLLSNKGKKTSYPIISWRLEKDGKVAIQDKILGILLQSQTERELTLKLASAKLSPGNYTFIGELQEDSQKTVPFNLKVMIP